MRKVIIGIIVVVVIGIIAGITHVWQTQSSASVGAMQTVTDSTGTQVDIPTHPKRVVFLNPSNLDLFVAAGGADMIVGKPKSEAFSPEVKQAVANVTEIGIIHSPNVEKILSLKPDLVIGVNVPFHNQIRKTLEDNGIPLYINSLDNYEDTVKTLTFFGTLTGKTDLVKQKIDELNTKVQEIEKIKQGKKSPKTLIIFSSPASNNMATGKSFSGDILHRLGGTNIADFDTSLKGAYVPLSMEYVVKQNPDTIFIISMGTSEQMKAQLRGQMKLNSAWNQLKAVQENRVFDLPMNLFTVNPGSHIGDAMVYMANCLYGQGGK